MPTPPPIPHKDAIEQFEPFPLLPRSRVHWVRTADEALAAADQLKSARAWGFDTESKPTFHRDQVSDGPHTVQLATDDQAWVFQLHDPACRALTAELLTWPQAHKAGFGLRDDRLRIEAKLGVTPTLVVELNQIFRRQGYRQEVGLKSAVALLFGQRFAKSKKTATSNWAAEQLSDSQLLYAANDAYGALRVYQALHLQR